MKILDIEDNDGPEPPSDIKGIKDLVFFEEEIAMLDRLKRKRIKAKLKKEKLGLLAEIVAINKKLKILEAIEEQEKKSKCRVAQLAVQDALNVKVEDSSSSAATILGDDYGSGSTL